MLVRIYRRFLEEERAVEKAGVGKECSFGEMLSFSRIDSLATIESTNPIFEEGDFMEITRGDRATLEGTVIDSDELMTVKLQGSGELRPDEPVTLREAESLAAIDIQ